METINYFHEVILLSSLPVIDSNSRILRIQYSD
jgi:hypothetical protein